MVLFRVLSAQPQADGEHWTIKGQIHSDDWYTDAYGQNPTPFYRNPQLAPREGPPYPWKPGTVVSHGQNTFGISVDTSSYPAQIGVYGNLPVNVATIVDKPSVPLQASTANSGGTIEPGSYLLAVSPNGVIGPNSSFVKAVVPVGTSANKVTISGIIWPNSAAPLVTVFAGTDALHMTSQLDTSWTGSSPDGNGNPTVIELRGVTSNLFGLPDVNFSTLEIQQTPIIHGGLWGNVLSSVNSTHVSGHYENELVFGGAAFDVDQWAGYTLTLYYRPGVTLQPIVNATISGNDPDRLLYNSIGPSAFIAGDVVVMRAKAAHISANTIGDDNFVSFYGPTGLNVNAEAGNLVLIVGGTGVEQPPKVIASNTSTVLTIDGTWDITPDSSTVWIIIGSSYSPVYTKTISVDGTTRPDLYGTVQVASGLAAKIAAQSILFQVATADANGLAFPMRYQPFREVYVPAQNVAAQDGYFHIDTIPVSRTITADINATQPTLSFNITPSVDVPFLCKIDGECVRITAISGVNVTTMERGVSGTTAASHTAGATALATFAPINLDNGLNQVLQLNGDYITVMAPTGGSIQAGSYFALYEDQDATGSRPGPEYIGGPGGFVSDTAAKISIDPTAETRTSIPSFTFHGTYWAQDTSSTGNAIT